MVQRVYHQKFLLAVIARFKAFEKRVPSYSNSKRPQRVSASKAKSSVLSQISGLENVVFNVFIDDALDSEDVYSLFIESEEERAAREADEMAALDAKLWPQRHRYRVYGGIECVLNRTSTIELLLN